MQTRKPEPLRTLLLAISLSALILQPTSAGAKELPKSTYAQDASSEANLSSHGSYINKYGEVIHSPAKSKSGKAPAGASAHCRDGSYSFSHSHRGTCSHHGGVANWL